MTTGGKIAIIGTGLVLGTTIGVLVYRNYRRNTPDSITYKIKKINPTAKTVEYEVLMNGKYDGGGTAIWSSSKVRLGAGENSTNAKNDYMTTYLPQGVILSSKSLGQSSGGKIIDFRNSSVKDFNGDAEKVLADTLKSISNVF